MSEDGRLTYSELAVAAADPPPVDPGELVALQLPTGLEYLIAYARLATAGAVTAGINSRLTNAEQDAIIQRARPTVVWDAEGMHRRAADTPTLPPDAVCVVFTSGTTGLPKGAVFGVSQLAAVCRADLGGDDVWGGGGPTLLSTGCSHVGFMTKFPTYLRSGATLVGFRRWRADDVLRAVAAHRIPIIGGVAPQIALLVRSPLIDSLDLSCVRSFVVGGALSTPALVTQARRRFGATYSIRYSSTESGGVGLGTDPLGPDEEVLHTIGRPRPGVEARIDRPDPDGLGELCLRSRTQMIGYLDDPEATAATIDDDGWLHTGDLAVIDDEGRFRLAGRIKEMYIRGGYNVYPAEVEAVLADHPEVTEVAVVPVPDAVMGEVGAACVVPRDPRHPPTLESLREMAAERLAPWKLPERIILFDELPRTGGDKIDRMTLGRQVVGEE